MRNYIYFCKDFEKFGTSQEWRKNINEVTVNFSAKRQNNNAWKVFFFFNGNKYTISFDAKTDFKPLYDRDVDYKYWGFIEAQKEIEDLARNLLIHFSRES